jgi:hypothetical protein
MIKPQIVFTVDDNILCKELEKTDAPLINGTSAAVTAPK